MADISVLHLSLNFEILIVSCVVCNTLYSFTRMYTDKYLVFHVYKKEFSADIARLENVLAEMTTTRV